MENIIGRTFRRGQDTIDLESIMEAKEFIAIYFGAHWAPPCRLFTPTLQEFYSQINHQDKVLEIIFCSKMMAMGLLPKLLQMLLLMITGAPEVQLGQIMIMMDFLICFLQTVYCRGDRRSHGVGRGPQCGPRRSGSWSVRPSPRSALRRVGLRLRGPRGLR